MSPYVARASADLHLRVSRYTELGCLLRSCQHGIEKMAKFFHAREQAKAFIAEFQDTSRWWPSSSRSCPLEFEQVRATTPADP
jgi:hypothetical protein